MCLDVKFIYCCPGMRDMFVFKVGTSLYSVDSLEGKQEWKTVILSIDF